MELYLYVDLLGFSTDSFIILMVALANLNSKFEAS